MNMACIMFVELLLEMLIRSSKDLVYGERAFLADTVKSRVETPLKTPPLGQPNLFERTPFLDQDDANPPLKHFAPDCRLSLNDHCLQSTSG